MALIKRFTPGGNVYPDGSSTFAMLVQFFQEQALNRDQIDAANRVTITQPEPGIVEITTP